MTDLCLIDDSLESDGFKDDSLQSDHWKNYSLEPDSLVDEFSGKSTTWRKLQGLFCVLFQKLSNFVTKRKIIITT